MKKGFHLVRRVGVYINYSTLLALFLLTLGNVSFAKGLSNYDSGSIGDLMITSVDVVYPSCDGLVVGRTIEIYATSSNHPITFTISPGGYTTTNTTGYAFFAGIPDGTYTITVLDNSGCMVTWPTNIVMEEVDPDLPVVATCPTDITVPNDAGVCAAVVNYALPTFNDACDGFGLNGALTMGMASGSSFPVGTTLVQYEYTDIYGNGPAICMFNIIVEDKEAPVASNCPAPSIIVPSDAGSCSAVVNFTIEFSDNCDATVSPGTLVAGMASGSTFPVGTTTVTYEHTDMAGNGPTQCSIDIIVLDTEAPVASTCPSNITVNNDPGLCSAVVDYTVEFTDNCDMPSLGNLVSGLASGSAFPAKQTIIVTYSYVDAAGNGPIFCQFSVTVNDAEQAVATTCPADITVDNDPGLCSAVVNYNVEFTDNCDGVIVPGGAAPPGNLSLTSGLASGSAFPANTTTTVTYTYTDACGNGPTSCTFDVTVNDAELASTTCPMDITVDNDAGECSAMVNFTVEFTDNCDMTITPTTAMIPGTLTLVSGMATGSAFPVGTTNVTYTYTDMAGNGPATCSFNITVNDAEIPVAVCAPNQSVRFTLDATGMHTIDGADLDGGSTDNCMVTFSANPPVLDCSFVGVHPIELTVTDDAGNSSSCTTNIEVFASAACPPPPLDNDGGPNVADPCTCRGNNEFDEEIFLQTTSTLQEWTIQSVNGLDAWAVGDMIVDNMDSTYSAVGIHVSGIGYTMELTSRFWPGFVVEISNTCFYPDPEIQTDLDGPICLFTSPITLEGFAGTKVDGTDIEGTSSFKINGATVTELEPMDLGLGVHTIELCFDAGDATGFEIVNGVVVGPPEGAPDLQGAIDDPGCESCISRTFEILETPDQLACNDNVQISFEENCEVNITPDMVLEGSYVCFDDYSVSIKKNNDPVSNPVGVDYWGQTLTVTITHQISGISCWGTISIEDKLGPKTNCETEWVRKNLPTQTGPNFTITCAMDIADVPIAIATDNCDPNPNLFLISETTTGDDCIGITVIRKYGSNDVYGNDGDDCEITINIIQPPIEFPDDITWTCEQYNAFPNIIDAHLLHPLLLANAAAMDEDDVMGVDPYVSGVLDYWSDTEDLDVMLDPNWDDDIDNPRTNAGPDCNTRTLELDIDICLFNQGSTYAKCVPNPNAHNPDTILVPVHDPALVEGFEDADLLALSGSGVPSVQGLDTDGCRYSVQYNDQLLEACAGVDKDIAFKILRTWTVLNWCDGTTTTDLQIIKVIDKTAPEVTFPETYDTLLFADQSFQSAGHPNCRSSGILGVPDFSDNCSGVDFSSLRVITPSGEATPIYDGGGNLAGFEIPFPFLERDTHTIVYQVSDFCGNQTDVEKEIIVIDGIAPIAVCREVTQIALSNKDDGLVAIKAEQFDEGSYDNCSPVSFLVRKMESRDNCSGFSEHNRFSNEVHFCCKNIGGPIVVVLRVYDRRVGDSESISKFEENSKDCMIEVYVEDRLKPKCVAPADIEIECDAYPDNIDLADVLNDFGTGSATDNCGASVMELPPNINVDLCGVGTILRQWKATDDSGNEANDICEQRITIKAKTDYTINIPDDFEEECGPVTPPEMTAEEKGCDLLAISYEEKELNASPAGECKKVIRTWRALNWCEYDGSSDPIVLPRADVDADGMVTRTNYDKGDKYTSDGTDLNRSDRRFSVPSTGYYQYEQHVKIFDNTAPVLSFDGDPILCGGDLDEDPCTGDIMLPITIDEGCTNTNSQWELTAFSTSFGQVDFSGNGVLTGRFPLGIHTVRYYISDECGNTSELDVTFEIVDCKAPTPVCHNGLSVELMPTGMVGVWALDFDASSFDYCHQIAFTANIVTDRNNDGVINSDDYLSNPPTADEVMFDCSHVGSITNVQLWVNELSSDDRDNWDYCVTYIEVQDNNGVCNGTRVAVGGTIKTDKGDPAADVMVDLNNANSVQTQSDGSYTFSNLPLGGDYSITPMKNDDITNGVSTYDLVLISKHVLSVELLDNPYKLIAADANNSGNISTLDLVAVRKVILRVASEFPNNTSWRFVDANMNPVINFNNLTTPKFDADFTIIKVGDVSGDAAFVRAIDDRSFKGDFQFSVSDKIVTAGERVEVPFIAQQNADGYQFTLNINEKLVDLIAIKDGFANQTHFNSLSGNVVTSWNAHNASIKGEVAFTLVIEPKSDARLSQILSIGSNLVPSEAYQGSDLLNVEIEFGTDEPSEFSLYQNTPNPFEKETSIGFTLPQSSEVTLTISDLSGKTHSVKKGHFPKGYNQVLLEDLPKGILFYELATPTHTATKKMTNLQ